MGDQDVRGSELPDFFDALLDDNPNELYENAPCGYISTLPDGSIVKANQTFLTWTGFSRAELVGRRRLQELFSVGDRIFYETHYAPLLQMQGTVREIAVDLVVRGGARLPVLANSVLRRDANGSPQFIRTVLFDARERRAYERELVAARQRAQESEEHARQLAETLQSTFLPPTALEIPGLDVAGVYRPAGDGTQVGGDFYDVFPTGHDTHAVVLGDVSGKGPSAAVVTALARYVVRAGTHHDRSPASVLRLVHEEISNTYPDRFCTALLLDITVGRDVQVTVAAAGHQLPIHTDGTTTTRVGSYGSMLGMVDAVEVQDSLVTLHPGHALILYTDGVSDARSDAGQFFGDDRVEQLAASHAGQPASATAVAIVDAAVDFQGGDTRDDIAVVVICRPLLRISPLSRATVAPAP
jgi:sigma-B regulation protein RsbU (phosphoserine phosphatase)